MVGKFRIFETMEEPSTADQVANYLATNSNVPVTRDEMVGHVVMKALKKVDISQFFKVKRQGVDLDPIFWSLGKIHGLENIAFAEEKDILATNGNPVLLQKLVNKCDKPNIQINSSEHLM